MSSFNQPPLDPLVITPEHELHKVNLFLRLEKEHKFNSLNYMLIDSKWWNKWCKYVGAFNGGGNDPFEEIKKPHSISNINII